MTPRIGRALLFLVFALALVPIALARGGRGGGGGGGARGGGGGGFRGGGGMGGGMPRGGGVGGAGGFGGGGVRPGGGFSHSPALSSPRPAQRPANVGGAGGRPSTLPAGPGIGNRPGAGRPGPGGRPSTLPSGPALGNRPGVGGPGPGNRPGMGNRPGIDNRPGGVGGIGNRPGIDNRPGGVGGVGGIGNRPGIDNRPGGVGGIGNRPGIDNLPGGAGGVGGIGNRPGIDNRPGGVGGVGGIGNRPGIDSRPGGIGGVGGVGNRPGIDNRPGAIGGVGGVGNRPGIDNRPGAIGGVGGVGNRPIAGGGNAIVGGGNTISRGDVNVGGIRQNNLAGIGVDPGYGVRAPAVGNWRGAYWGYHSGWANGYWHGYHDSNNWGWGRFAAGTALGVTAWALGSSYYNWGYGSYGNPYYAQAVVEQPIVIEQTIVGGEPQSVTVPALAYDYSQPIDTAAAPPSEEAADPALAKFSAARENFRTGDYAGALRLVDEALKVLPNDATLHEFRGLVLFAAGKYDLAAGPLYAVLSVGPGWDWTTMIGLYPSADTYTAQLRKLEAFVRANRSSSAGRFVLAYHYLTQGNIDAAVSQFKEVAALVPDDKLSAQLARQFSKPADATEPASAPATAIPATAASTKPGKLPGRWTAHPTNDTTIHLNAEDGGDFTWTVDSKGKEQKLSGKWSLADNLLTLAQSDQGGALVGRLTWQADNKWNFRVIGSGAEDPGLTFAR